MKATSSLPLLAAVLVAALFTSPAFAGFHSDRMQAIADSSKPVAVPGGVAFDVPQGYDATFRSVVTALKKENKEIAEAKKDAGTIATEIVVSGHWRQTGVRTVVSLIDGGAHQTTVKVSVTMQKRYKALQTEPWSEPKLDKKATEAEGAALKTALGGK